MALSDVKRLAVRAHRIFKAVSALPLVLLVAVVWKSSRLEGWSGWAFAAAVGPLLVGFSALMAGIGAALWSIERRKGRNSASLAVATLLAAAPLLWFCFQIISHRLMRSG